MRIVRREMLNGREHIVAPVRMLVPGVLNGSQGPGYYPPEEVAKNPTDWDHSPITINHPDSGSARKKHVLNRQQIGVVLESKIHSKSGALQALGYFDIERTRQLSPAILQALENGESIELSTGLNGTLVKAAAGSNYKGKRYDFIVQNLKPDHLAILVDQQGACSIKDGCGVNMENSKAKRLWNRAAAKFLALMGVPVTAVDTFTLYNRDWPQSKRDKLDSADFAGPDKSFPITSQTDVDAAAKLVGHAADPEAVKAKIKEIAKRKGLSVPKEWETVSNSNTEELPIVAKKLVEADRKKLIDGLITNCGCSGAIKFSEDDRELLNDFSDERLQEFTIQRDALVMAEPIVNAASEFVGIDNGGSIAATLKLGEKQKALLENMPAAMKAALQRKIDAKKGKGGADDSDEEETEAGGKGKGKSSMSNNSETTPKQQTEEEYLESMPPRLRAVVENAMKIEADEKARLIEVIKNHKGNTFTDEDLAGMDTRQLKPIAKIASTKVENDEGSDEVANGSRRRRTQHGPYAGQAAPVNNGRSRQSRHSDEDVEEIENADAEDIEMLRAPVIDYKAEAAEIRNMNKSKTGVA